LRGTPNDEARRQAQLEAARKDAQAAEARRQAAEAEAARKQAAADEARRVAEFEAATKRTEAERALKELEEARRQLADARRQIEDVRKQAQIEEAKRQAEQARRQAEVEQSKQQFDSTSAAMPVGRRIALVIGNSMYFNVAALPNAATDASAIASALRETGFQVVMLERDLRRQAMIAALRKFELEAQTADWAVIYYAGHGIEIGGINYLIPIDARLASDRDIEDEGVSLGRVVSATDTAKKLRLVLLDACRENPFITKMSRTFASRSIGRGLARIEPEAGSMVVYSARDGQIALDGDGKHSPFASSLLRRLPEPNVEIGKLFRLVRDDVLNETKRRQEPFIYGSLPGEDFFFVPKK
jgi:hypothetical protein